MNAQRWEEKKVNLPAWVKLSEPPSTIDSIAQGIVALIVYLVARIFVASLVVDFGSGYNAALASVAGATCITVGWYEWTGRDALGVPGHLMLAAAGMFTAVSCALASIAAAGVALP